MKRVLMISLVFISLILISGIAGCSPTAVSQSKEGTNPTAGKSSVADLSNLCDKITSNMELKIECMAIAKQDPSLCKSLINKYYSENEAQYVDDSACKVRYAVIFKNQSSCEENAGQNLAYYCNSIATNSGDCSKLPDIDPTAKSLCYLEMAFIEKNPLLCENTASINRNQECYLNLAIINNDLNLCYKAQPDKVMPTDCMKAVAKFTGNVSICDQITAWEKKEYGYPLVGSDCYYSISMKKLDASICDKMDSLYDSETIISCKDDVNAIIKNDFLKCHSTYCENQIYPKTGKYPKEMYHYLNIALEKKDINICYKLESYAQENCIMDIVESNYRKDLPDYWQDTIKWEQLDKYLEGFA